MTRAEEMKAELSAVLSDPVFARAPVLTRLLTYLVQESVAERGAALKSYAVAVDGLGRPADFDPQSDSYARVQVARLRRTLQMHYADPSIHRSHQLYIAQGSYEVSLRRRLMPDQSETAVQAAAGEPSAVPVALAKWARPFRGRGMAVAMAFLLILMIAALVVRHSWLPPSDNPWVLDDFPTVAVTAVAVPQGADEMSDAAENMQLALIKSLEAYDSLRINDGNGGKAEYALKLELRREGQGMRAVALLINREENSIVWSWSHQLPAADATAFVLDEARAGDIAYQLAQTTGVIHAHQRASHTSAQTPYGCWLLFGEQWYKQQRLTGAELDQCSRDWYASAPNDALAAMVRGWVLTDQARAEVGPDIRRRILRDAIQVTNRAVQISPRSVSVRLLALHVACFADNMTAFALAANHPVLNESRSPDVMALLGWHKIMHNDLSGLRQLQAGIARHFNPPPWYQLGLLVAAIARDEVPAARTAIAATSLRDAPLQRLLSVATLAREGQVARARRGWRAFGDEWPEAVRDPEYSLQTWPCDPRLRARVRSWLKPALPN